MEEVWVVKKLLSCIILLLRLQKLTRLRAAGIHTGAWTVDDSNVMQNLLKLGIKRIYTDDPKTITQIKKVKSYLIILM